MYKRQDVQTLVALARGLAVRLELGDQLVGKGLHLIVDRIRSGAAAQLGDLNVSGVVAVVILVIPEGCLLYTSRCV